MKKGKLPFIKSYLTNEQVKSIAESDNRKQFLKLLNN